MSFGLPCDKLRLYTLLYYNMGSTSCAIIYYHKKKTCMLHSALSILARTSSFVLALRCIKRISY